MTNVCPNCEVGNLAPRFASETLRYGDQDLVVDGIEFSVCDVCAEEIVTPEQAKSNDIRFADAKRASDGLLLSNEIREFLDTYHLSQTQAARIFGGGVNAFSRYERGDVIQSTQMDLLLRLARDIPVARDCLFAWGGVSVAWHTDPCEVVHISSALDQRLRVLGTARSVSAIENPRDDWQPIANSL